jgi:hypothetical protein
MVLYRIGWAHIWSWQHNSFRLYHDGGVYLLENADPVTWLWIGGDDE